jgi:ferredoxin
MFTRLLLVVLFVSINVASAFQSTPLSVMRNRRVATHQPTSTQLEFFFGGGKEKTSAKDQVPKLLVTVNGKPVPSARPGQKILAVAKKARVNIPTYCERGACGTCTCYLNGRKVHACMEKLPAGRAEIQTLTL